MSFCVPGQPVRKGLYAVALFYGLIVRFRLWFYRSGWISSSRVPCPVVSVGNLTVGGTGKTPVVILLTEWLQAKGRRVAVLSRGYKRTSRPPHVLVSNGAQLLAGPAEAGDEPFLIARRCPQAIVAVGTDRAALSRWVLQQYAVDCIVLDDGFQHLALCRDVDLVLLDATDASGLDAMLPAGRLREPLRGLVRATAVIITRADSKVDIDAVRSRLQACHLPVEHEIEVRFQPESLVSVCGAVEERKSLEWCRDKKVWLVSGIGNSNSFRQSAGLLGVKIVGETAFQDHHHYDAEEVRRIRANAQAISADLVLTTEKDSSKLSPMVAPGDPWWALRIRAEVVRGEDQLRRLVIGDGGIM